MKPIHFLVGVAAGAALGLLCAPKTGAKTRAFLAKKTKRSMDDLQRQALAAGKQAYRQVMS